MGPGEKHNRKRMEHQRRQTTYPGKRVKSRFVNNQRLSFLFFFFRSLKTFKFIVLILFKNFFIKRYLIYNVLLISALQQSDSVIQIYIYIYIYIYIFFFYLLFIQEIGYSSL